MSRNEHRRNFAWRAGIIAAILGATAVVSTGHAAVRSLSDAAITGAVDRSLLIDDAVPFNDIDVVTRGGIVTLSGTVHSLQEAERAVQQAQSIKGVRAVVDQLAVTPSHRADADIKGDVMAALMVNPATDSYEVNTTVFEGTVTLAGAVQSWAEKHLAETVAKGVKGVKGIRNDIRIVPKTDRSDGEIHADIAQRIKHDVWLADDHINVEVSDGTVSLKGNVGSAFEKSRAVSLAYVYGAKTVDNSGLEAAWRDRSQLKRTESASPSDAEIKRAVKDAFLFDPRVGSFDSDVRVTRGTVYLSGVVESLLAKHAAVEDARNTVGVKSVRNQLKVRPKDPVPDDTLARNVRSALLWDPLLDRYDLTTVVHDGTVSLHGRVDSYSEKTRATYVASGVNGVLDVRNRLAVDESWTWARDWEIKQDIEDQLWWSPFVDSGHVQVTVTDGSATLRGRVDSWWERAMAADNALEGGAKSVRNYLSVAVD